MEINILRALKNNGFVSRADERYYQLTIHVKRIWVEEKIDISPDCNAVYEIKFSSGKVYEGHIIQTGRDEAGYYFLFRLLNSKMAGAVFDESKVRIPRGNANIKAVFKPDTFDGARELLKATEGAWPYFHQSLMKLQKMNGNILLHFQEGCLRDLSVDLMLFNVLDVNYIGEQCNSIECFYEGKINDIYIRKGDSDYIVTIDNSYTDFIPLGKYDCFSENVKYDIQKHENKAVFRCSDLKVEHTNLFLKELNDKEIACICLDNKDIKENLDAESLKQRWLYEFASGVNTEGIYIDQYLWHIFSYKKLECAEREEAYERLKSADKESLYIFFQHSDVCYMLSNAQKFNTDIIRFYRDIYVVSQDFSWTFIITHETEMCGPYFYSKNM